MVVAPEASAVIAGGTMKARRRVRLLGIALATLAAIGGSADGSGARAFPEAVTSPETGAWERFRFAVPGETTIADAIGHLGKPDFRVETSVPDGEIDVIGPTWTSVSDLRKTHRRARDRGVPVVRVGLLQWHRTDPARHGLGVGQYATLVFRGDHLWYAVTPPSPGEATPAQLGRLHSHPPQSSTVTRVAGDLGYRVKVLAFPAQGVAYTLHRERVDAKVVFPPTDIVRFASDEEPDEEPSPK